MDSEVFGDLRDGDAGLTVSRDADYVFTKLFGEHFGHDDILPGGLVTSQVECRQLLQQTQPTTQGKIERFWQTLKRFLAQHPARTLTALQTTLDAFTVFYNEVRPHRAIARKTPAFAYALIPKATPTRPDTPDVWQVRYDIVGATGTVSLRHGGTLKHLGVGRRHARTEIICLVHGHDATVITHTGEVLGEYVIDPEKDYQAKNTRTH